LYISTRSVDDRDPFVAGEAPSRCDQPRYKADARHHDRIDAAVDGDGDAGPQRGPSVVGFERPQESGEVKSENAGQNAVSRKMQNERDQDRKTDLADRIAADDLA
jgi:hypothetical protein